VCISLCTTVVHNTAQNSSDISPSYLPDSHHSSDDVCWRGRGLVSVLAISRNVLKSNDRRLSRRTRLRMTGSGLTVAHDNRDESNFNDSYFDELFWFIATSVILVFFKVLNIFVLLNSIAVVRRIVTVAFLRRVQIFLLTYLRAWMWPIVTDRVAWSVGLSVTVVSPAKTAALIEMPFGLWTLVGSRNHVLGHTGATWRIPMNRPCAVAMRSVVKLLWPLVSNTITIRQQWLPWQRASTYRAATGGPRWWSRL